MLAASAQLGKQGTHVRSLWEWAGKRQDTGGQSSTIGTWRTGSRFSQEPPKEIARRAYLAACEARGRHLRQMETWARVTDEEQRRVRLEWLAVHERVKQLEDAAAAVLRDPTAQARQCLADILRSSVETIRKGRPKPPL